MRSLMVVTLGALLAAGWLCRAQEKEPETYFTAVNIWCADPRSIPTTNYHAGEIIPVGTKVTLKKLGGLNIVFATEDGKTYTILHMLKHSTIKLENVFARLFSLEDALSPEGAFHKLTKLEQKAVSEGTIYEGMSRAAVLMAYGFPPSHRTPDLEAKTWTYWRGRMRTVVVTFDDDGLVETIRGLPRPEPKKDRRR